MRIVFFKTELKWPLRTGSSVHSGNLMKTFVSLGHQVVFVSEVSPCPEAKAWLSGVEFVNCADVLSEPKPISDDKCVSWIQRRVYGYFGIPIANPVRFANCLHSLSCDHIVAVGSELLPYLKLVPEKYRRVWYVADDPLLHIWTVSGLWGLMDMLRFLIYQLSFRKSFDQVWLVSERDANWQGRLCGKDRVAVVPNGVDFSKYFSASRSTVESSDSLGEKTCCFWGNLSFAPNEDLLRYFIGTIWPRVLNDVPDAVFEVAGSHSSIELRGFLESTTNVRFLGEVRDINESLTRSRIAVFPFRKGAGVKNKLLEAAAMGKAIIANPIACNGLRGDWQSGISVVNSVDEWVDSITCHLLDRDLCERKGMLAEQWVRKEHSWEASAEIAIRAIESCQLPYNEDRDWID